MSGTIRMRDMRVALAAAGVLAGTALGCAFPPEPGAPPGSVPVTLLGIPDTAVHSLTSGFENRHRLWITTPVDWQQYWDSLVADLPDPKPALPVVDFSQYMVISVAMGRNREQMPGAEAAVAPFGAPSASASESPADPVALAKGPPWYDIRIEGVWELDGDLWVSVKVFEATLHCEAPRLWTPVMAVRVPRQTGRVTFIERGELVTC